MNWYDIGTIGAKYIVRLDYIDNLDFLPKYFSAYYLS